MPWEALPLESLWHVGAVVLGLAIAIAILHNARRNRRNDRITEQATKELYDHPERYDRTKRELEKQVEG
jgi:hypothetical protein